MGGGFYSVDVAQDARSGNRGAFSYSGYGVDASQANRRRDVHAKLNIENRVRECMNETPIVVALDVTRSRGQDTKIVYDKLPQLMGRIHMKNYVPGPALSFCAVGDAYSDQAPLQVGQFEADNRLDEVLSLIWIEEGGGGTGQESYELCAYFYARHSILASLKQGRKGYFFFVGDESFYPRVDHNMIRKVCGREETADIPAAQIFRELQDKYHTFLIFPKKSFEDRKADIDAEIKQRVTAAGGQYHNVDVRASLIWNNRNDLDLHVVCPSGEHIYYGHKQSKCRGWLDVDMNVQGETIKPVENVRWERGKAPAGRYKIYVQNFRFHESAGPTPYRVEVEIFGEFQRFEGTISPNGETGPASDQVILEFTVDPEQLGAQRQGGQKNRSTSTKDAYKLYDDQKIRNEWAAVLPPENILLIEDPENILDVLLGAIALKEGTSSLDTYLEELQNDNVSQDNRSEIAAALAALKGGAPAGAPPGAVDISFGDDAGLDRGGSSRRL